MKRMTYRLYDQNGNQTEYVAYDAQFMLEHANEIGGIGIFPESKREELALRRLAEFEDAGMDPGEFAKLLNDFASAIAADTALSMTCGPDRAHEIMAAEAEKRLLVLPCKVGDPVWVVDRGEILEEKVLNFCTFMKSNGTVMTVMTTTYRDYLTRPNVANIGKLVPNMLSFFLTREEAERALAKERDS